MTGSEAQRSRGVESGDGAWERSVHERGMRADVASRAVVAAGIAAGAGADLMRYRAKLVSEARESDGRGRVEPDPGRDAHSPAHSHAGPATDLDSVGLLRGRDACVPTGVGRIDRLFGGGLPWRGIHEWIGMCFPSTVGREPSARECAASHMGLPVGAMLSVVHRAVTALDRMRRRLAGVPIGSDAGLRRDANEAGCLAAVLWIGRDVWPHPRALVAGVRSAWASAWWGERRGGRLAAWSPEASLVERSVFVDPIDAMVSPGPARRSRRSEASRSGGSDSCSARTWAIEQALRCEDVGVVVADGSGLSMAETRRLHLAMASRASPQLLFLARPPSDRAMLSAALTRWMVMPTTPEATLSERHLTGGEWDRSLWTAHLLRCKATLASGVIRAAQRYGLTSVADPPDLPGGLEAMASARLGVHWESLAEEEDVVMPALASA